MKLFLLAAPAAAVVLSSVPAFGQARALFTGLPGDPTNTAPGTTLTFNASTSSQTAFGRPFVSPDGSLVGFKGDLEQSGTFFDDVIVVAPLATPATGSSLQEGFAVPGSTAQAVGFDQKLSLLDNGTIGFTGQARVGTLTEPGDRFYTWDGSTVTLAVQPGTVVNDGTIQANTINSPYLAPTGGLGYQAFIDGVPIEEDARVIFDGATVLASGTTPAGAPAVTSLFEFESTSFGNNGQSYLTQARSFPPSRTVDTTIVDGVAVIVGGQPLPGGFFSSAVTDTSPSFAHMVESGDWVAQGSNVDGTQWALLNGVPVGVEGEAVFSGSADTWSDIDGVSTDGLGNYTVFGNTSAGDQAVVLNGETVLIRTGDPIDLDGDGLLDDDLFIRDFSVDDAVLSTNGDYVFAARLQNGSGSNRGHALLAITIPEPATAGLLGIGSLALLRRRRP
jgi:hypothetical protein